MGIFDRFRSKSTVTPIRGWATDARRGAPGFKFWEVGTHLPSGATFVQLDVFGQWPDPALTCLQESAAALLPNRHRWAMYSKHGPERAMFLAYCGRYDIETPSGDQRSFRNDVLLALSRTLAVALAGASCVRPDGHWVTVDPSAALSSPSDPFMSMAFDLAEQEVREHALLLTSGEYPVGRTQGWFTVKRMLDYGRGQIDEMTNHGNAAFSLDTQEFRDIFQNALRFQPPQPNPR